MTYWGLNAVFLGVVAAVGIAALLARRAPRWRAVGVALVPMLLLTAVFDNIMIGVGLVGYDPERISGVFVGPLAPIEDFSYTLAAVVLLPALWTLLPARRIPTPSLSLSPSSSPPATADPVDSPETRAKGGASAAERASGRAERASRREADGEARA